MLPEDVVVALSLAFLLPLVLVVLFVVAIVADLVCTGVLVEGVEITCLVDTAVVVVFIVGAAFTFTSSSKTFYYNLS